MITLKRAPQLHVPRRYVAWILRCGLALCVLATASSTQGQDTLRQKEQAQEKARLMAKQLVSSVLDIQLRQLKENGLDQREIYRDILTMRDNIDELVAEEMKGIVELLIAAQEGPEQTRLEKFQQVRPAIRDVVVRLLAERQRLQRRLKSARLAAEVRRLLEQQSKAYRRAADTMDLPEGVRERRALQVAEDQRDVTAMYYQMVALLVEMRSWNGPVGAAAGRGVTLLQTTKVEPDLKSAASSLENADFAPAMEAQRRVIRALQALLEQIEAARGMVSSDRAELVRKVDQLMERQEQVREKTLGADLEQPQQRDALEDAQREIHKSLGELSDAIKAAIKADPVELEQAKESALDSVDALFEANADTAAAEQSEVLGNLSQLRDEILKGAAEDRSEKSSDDLLQEQQKLERASQLLRAAEAQENAAERSQPTNPAAAAAQEDQAAKQLQQAAEQLPSSNAKSRLEEAANAADRAKETLKDEAAEAAAKRQAVADAKDALEAAKGELAVRLADVQRHRLAVEVGELARAAETLERAAAAQRSAANKLDQVKEDPAKVHEIAEQQPQVRDIADDIAAGVRRTAPQAQNELAAAKAEANRAEPPLRKMTTGDSKPHEDAAAKSALNRSADQLEKAAAEIRKQQGATAEQLANVAGKQLSEVAPTRAAAQEALQQAQQAANPAESLQRALDKVQEASRQQLKAEGRGDLAEAKTTQQKANEVANAQQAAEQALENYAQGKSNSPLEAAARQQNVADKAKALADAIEKQPNQAEAAAQLRRAARKAEEAARSALLDTPAKAKQAQQAVADAVDAAKKSADDQVAKAEQAPAKDASPEAQGKVAEAAADAQRQAAEAAGGEAAKEPLNQAQQAATKAEQAIRGNQPEQTKASQQATRQALGQAETKLKEAIAAAQQNEQKKQGELASKAAQLADKAANQDPAAARALREAAQLAQAAAEGQTPSEPEPSNQSQPNQAQQGEPENGKPQNAGANQPSGKGTPQRPQPKGAQRPLERAVASLAAREQEIRRDFDVAATLADLAREQQAAREDIKQQAKQLGDLAKKSADATDQGQADPHLPQRQAAAQSLQQATQKFAAAQQATGQGAVQISGQEEVVNQPIREGLQKASELPVDPPQAQSGDGQPGEGQPGEGQPGEGQPGEGQPGEGQPGEGQPGEGQPGEGQPGEGQPGEGQPGEGQPGEGQPGEGQPGQGQPGRSTPSDLGTSMVPNSAKVTAEQIAGNDALRQALEALEAAPPSNGAEQGSSSPNGTGQPSPGSQKSDDPSSPEKDDTKPGVDSVGGPEQATATDASDRDAKPRAMEGEPWFAKLPPSLQQAIRARARREAPRGYEERLRRYFESGQ